MEQLARPGTTLITAETLNLAGGYVQVQSLGAIPIRGMADTVAVFEVVGGGTARRRFEAAVTRELTCFVGRQTELAVLGQALERARTGHGQLVAPVGEPGVGKSRLYWIDSESQAVLDSLVESLPGARILLLVNYRPEYQHSWGRKSYYTQLRLDPLPPEGAEELRGDARPSPG